MNLYMSSLLALTAGEIAGIITGVASALVAVIAATGKCINEIRRAHCDSPKCCMTGKPLKPKKGKKAKKNS